VIEAVDADGNPLPLAESLLGGATATDVSAAYNITRVELGSGAFATTRLCFERSTGRRFAVKSICKRRLVGLSRDWTDVHKEVQVMHHLAGHPNMVELVDTFEDNAYVHLVMELCSGGCILERVMEEVRWLTYAKRLLGPADQASAEADQSHC
jgi:calcium-dependent protein kinase